MSFLPARGSRGASVLAAVAFVAIFGMIAMVIMNIAPSNSQNYTAQTAAAATAATDPSAPAQTSTVSDQCKQGEVHFVNEAGGTGNTDVGGKPSDLIYDCWIKDPKNPPALIPNPAKINTAQCKLADKNKCIVMYCPIGSDVSKPNSCIKISCDASNAGGAECLKKGLGAAMTSPNAFTAIASMQSQLPSNAISGLTFDTGSGQYSETSVSDVLKPQGNDALSTATQIAQNNTQIDTLAQQVNACSAAGEACDQSTIASLATQQQALQVQNAQLQQTLSDQMAGLKANQTGIYPGTDQPGVSQNPNITGSIPPTPGTDQPGVADYCKNNPTACTGNTMTTPLPQPRPAGAPAATPVAAPTNSGGNFLSSLFGGGSTPASRAASNGLFYALGSMVGSLISGNGLGGATAQQQMACATNQDQYQQQQQQYNQQIQQYNYQLQQQQYQQQYRQQPQQYTVGYDQYGQYITPVNQPYGYQSNQYIGGNSTMGQPTQPPPPQPPQPCYNNQQPQQCSYSPQQPSYDSCTSGTWKSTTSGNGCISGWQCIPNGATNGGTSGGTSGGTGGTTNTNTPVATISCQPKIADVGMTIAISYACANATQSVGGGFNTGGALSGSATTTLSSPPQNTNTVTYTLTCNNQGSTAGAQCSVQYGNPGIVFLANPGTIKPGESTTLGWVTSGMQSCIVSSPDQPSFTAQNSGASSPNGVAIAAGLTANTRFSLNCTTAGGATASASTTVVVAP